MLRQQTAKDQVCIGDGKWSAFAVTCWARVCGSGLCGQLERPNSSSQTHLGPHHEHAMPVEQPRPAPSGDCVDIKLRRLDNHCHQLLALESIPKLTLRRGRLEDMLQLPAVPTNVRTRSAHVDRDERIAPLHIITRLAVSHNSAGWAGQNGPQARKVVPGAEAAVGLHEQQLLAESLEAALEA